MIETTDVQTDILGSAGVGARHVSAAETLRLIEAARRHPRELEFLRHGDLGAVAVTFGVHAFTVEAARAILTEEAKGAADGLS